MKKLTLLFSLVLAAGLAIAQEKVGDAAGKRTINPSVQKTKAEFVSFDASNKTVTLKLDSRETVTWSWFSPDTGQAKSLKAGQKVVVTHKQVSGKESVVGVAVR